MPAVLNMKYKNVVEYANKMPLPLLDKMTLLIEELCEKRDKNHSHEYDYTTIAQAAIELIEKEKQNAD